MRRLISSGSSFEKEAGYSRAVVDGEWVFVAGTTGFDYTAMTIADDPAEQARQALRNIAMALAEAGAGLADVVRVKYYLPDAADWPRIVPVLGEAFGTIRPAATALICGLIDSRMKIEIEVTARRGAAAQAHREQRMRRRNLIAALGVLAVALPAAGWAQQQERIRRIGYLTPATGSPEDELGVAETRAVVEGLRELGWADGRNVVIEHRFSGSGRERIKANAKELVALNPDAIISVGGPPLAALLAETRTIPILFVQVSDPVGSGFVSNLAHPGGNATGFATQEAAIAGKWLELLKEAAPQVTRAGVIIESDSPPQVVLRDAAAAVAPALNLTLTTIGVRETADLERGISAFGSQPSGGLIVFPNAVTARNLQLTHALAVQHRLPAVAAYPSFAKAGALISYGPDPIAQYRGVTGYVDRVLRGAKPGDLPVQLPTKFVLVVNLKTAQELGLTVPRSLLARADEVIE